MLIGCPNCKRILHVPVLSGEHSVVCSGCGKAFSVVSEAGIHQILSTSISDTAPSETPTPPPEPPVLLPAIETRVFEDDAPRRTRSLHRWFLIGALLATCYLRFRILSERDLQEPWHLLLMMSLTVAVAGGMFGAYLALLVGYIQKPNEDRRVQGDEMLERLETALDRHTPNRDDDDPPVPSTSDLLRKEPPI